MPEWIVKRTDTFLKYLKQFKNHHEILSELDNKLKRLHSNPASVGGNLSGNLHGYKSTRLSGKFRLIFQIDEKNKVVYLVAIDHRKSVYEN